MPADHGALRLEGLAQVCVFFPTQQRIERMGLVELIRGKETTEETVAKAIDYSLGRWQALTRYIDDGDLPADNNWVENQIRPIAIGRSNWEI